MKWIQSQLNIKTENLLPAEPSYLKILKSFKLKVTPHSNSTTQEKTKSNGKNNYVTGKNIKCVFLLNWFNCIKQNIYVKKCDVISQ